MSQSKCAPRFSPREGHYDVTDVHTFDIIEPHMYDVVIPSVLELGLMKK